MRDRYVVDTNVLIAASAADPVNPADIDATPDDPAQRRKVWEWLCTFQECAARMILDSERRIYEEYSRKLDFGDFGIQVVMHKFNTCSVDYVAVEYDENGHGVLPPPLQDLVHDDEDRKMVAAAMASMHEFGEGCVAFAGDTDWHDWEVELTDAGLILYPIIEDWSRQKHAEKKKR